MPSIAIDGPSGAGKTDISNGVSDRLGLIHLDSGAMYRAVGLYMTRLGVDLQDKDAISRHMQDLPLSLRFEGGQQRVLLEDEDVTDLLAACSTAASMVGQVETVRACLNARMQKLARERGVLINGRDIGIAVLPDASLKIYLTADARVRARRRHLQMLEKGIASDEDQVYRDLLERDYQDTHRPISPLARAHDAVVVDSTNMTLEEVITEIVRLARRAGI